MHSTKQGKTPDSYSGNVGLHDYHIIFLCPGESYFSCGE